MRRWEVLSVAIIMLVAIIAIAYSLGVMNGMRQGAQDTEAFIQQYKAAQAQVDYQACRDIEARAYAGSAVHPFVGPVKIKREK